MTRTIYQAAEYVAREFLGGAPADGRIVGEHLLWTILLPRKMDIEVVPSWPFFGALWEECKRRAWVVGAETAHENEQCVWIEGAASSVRLHSEGDPREALIRAVELWLDAREGEG